MKLVNWWPNQKENNKNCYEREWLHAVYTMTMTSQEDHPSVQLLLIKYPVHLTTSKFKSVFIIEMTHMKKKKKKNHSLQ